MIKRINTKYLIIAIICALIASVTAIYSSRQRIPINSSEVLGEIVGNPDGYVPSSYISMGIPADVEVLADGNIWYIDEQNFRLVLISPSGQILRTIGREGTGEGEFSNTLTSFTRDTNGNIYVLDYCHVYKLDANGGFISSWGECSEVTESSMSEATSIHFDNVSKNLLVSDTVHHRILKFSTNGTYLGAFGTLGSGNGQLNRPQGIATDTTGKIYVVDGENHRVQVFSAAGAYLTKFGSNGVGNGEFTYPKDIVILSNGKIAVTSQNSQRVQIFNANGTFNSEWGENGTDAWQFLAPRNINRDANDNLYVSDWVNKSIQKFSQTGTYISAIRNSGKTNGKLNKPTGIAYDSTGNMYIIDDGCCGNGRVQKFTNAGTYLDTIISADLTYASYHIAIDSTDRMFISHVGGVYVYDLTGTLLFEFGTSGLGDGEFNEARDIDFDSLGNIYVSDYGQHRIQKFDSNGVFIAKWGTRGTGNGQFGGVGNISISGTDEIYVAEYTFCDSFPDYLCIYNSRVQVFDTSGTYLRTIGTFGAQPEQLSDISGITLNSTGDKIYVSNVNTNNIKVYSTADGTYLETIGKWGSGAEEFTNVTDITWNPVTDTLSVADEGNHRVQTLNAGVRIFNLIASADVSRTIDNASLVTRYYSVMTPGIENIDSRLYFGNYVVSDFTVDLTEERNWQLVTVNALIGESKALVNNLNPSDAPGISPVHSLYIVKQAGQNSVHVCPNAVSIDDLTFTCDGGYDLIEGVDATLSTVTIDSVEYWKVSELTGTGVLSPVPIVTPPATTVPATSAPTIATTTPTSTPITTTVAATPTQPIATASPIPVVSLQPVAQQTSPTRCPRFESFTSSATIIQKGEQVNITWTAIDTEIVTTVLSAKTFNPVDTYKFTPTKTTVAQFIADNGTCTAKKEITITVVESLPWSNALVVGASALAVEAVVATQASVSFGNMWLALASLGDRRKKRSWGYVYNAVTKKPIARAVIRLIEKSSGIVVDTVVSEANGAFRLTPKKGVFILKVSQKEFAFPSNTVTGDVDGGYTSLYHGEDITVATESDTILLSVPMDPLALSARRKAALRTKSVFTSIGGGLSWALLFGGLAYTLYMSIVMPLLLNFISLGVYSFIVGLKLFVTISQPRVQGRVTLKSGTVVAGLELGLYDADFENLLHRTFTSNEGLYSFAVVNKAYTLKIMDSHYSLVGNNGETLTAKSIPPSHSSESTMLIANDLRVTKN